MIRRLLLGGAVLAGIGWAAVAAIQDEASPALSPDPDQGNQAAPAPETGPAPRRTTPPAAPLPAADTPMAERVAVIGVLNKRDGIARDLVMRPGEMKRVGPLVVRLRACETTADWEDEQLTGAFVQAYLRGADGHFGRIFSGWLYKESPSLNAVENPYWDVWPKACRMVHAETGPDTIAAAAVAASGARSIARKSAEPAPNGDAAPAEPEPAPSASSNSAT